MNSVLRIYTQKGAALIGLIAAVLLISVLAAAIMPMISASNWQSVTANLTTKAYLLAESGYRYAASQFLHAGESEQDQNQILENLDGDYHLGNNDGTFALEVFSYFFELTQPVNGQTQFSAHAPGNYPGNGTFPDDPGDEIALSDDLKLRIGEQTYTLTSGSSQTSEDTVIFRIDTPLSRYPAGTPVYPVADVNLAINTAIDEGDNLSYESGDALMFPLRNGTIQLNGRTLTYRFNNRSANQFEDVRASTGQPALANFDLTANPQIVLTRYVRLHATGIYGSGAEDEQIRRRVVYYTPLPMNASNAQQQEYTDRFNTADNWSDTPGTATSSGDVGGNSALTVDSTSTSGEDQKGALTTFAPSSSAAVAINFSAAQRGTRGYLSYDTQIKVGFEEIPVPTNGYFPDLPIPAYAGAGLSFRLGGTANLFSNNGYGLSILRGNNNLADDDDIPDELVPLQDERAIVLWRQTDDGSSRTWLAYKRLVDLVFEEDNENAGSNAFSESLGSTNLWDLEPLVIGNPSRQRNGSTRNWYYGIIGFGMGDEYTYNWRNPPFFGPPVRNFGAITSNNITLSADSGQIFLTFWSWHQTEPGSLARPLDTYDLKQIIVLGSPNTTYTIDAAPLPGPEIITPPGADGWYQARIDLSTYAGQTIRIRFNFDTVDEIENQYEGWYIDDVQLFAGWPVDTIQEATIGLGLKEAMVVRFRNGTAQIFQGDRIYGERGTSGTVLSPPMISSGTWADGNASGTLLLNNTTVRTTGAPFELDEQFFVMGNTGQAQVSSWDTANDTKANIIQVYLATRDGRGSGGNNNPLDRNTAGYARLGADDDLVWPPILDDDGNWTDDDGNWTTSEDVFQLIEWDEINSSASGLSIHAFTAPGLGIVNQAVLQSHHNDLQTPEYPGIFEQPEVGLHSMGDGADNVYFDDFGVRLNVYETDILPSPIQQ